MPSTGSNTYDPDLVKGLVGEILEAHDAIASLNHENAERVAVHRGTIGGIYKRAKALGVNTRALKEHVKSILEDQKREDRRRDLDIDDRSALELIKDALGGFGELPLGQAAIKAAGKPGFIDTLSTEEREAFVSAEQEQLQRDNTERLQAGIKPLDTTEKKPRGKKQPEPMQGADAGGSYKILN